MRDRKLREDDPAVVISVTIGIRARLKRLAAARGMAMRSTLEEMLAGEEKVHAALLRTFDRQAGALERARNL